MSDNKNKTMIGTMAPKIPTRPPAVTPAQPTAVPSPGPAAPTPSGPAAPTVYGAQHAPAAPAPYGAPSGPAAPTVYGAQSPAAPAPYGAPSGPNVPTVQGGPNAPMTQGAQGAAPGELAPLVGHELCGYTIKRKLAEGGMGEVFEGEHARIGRRGAIKVLKLELCRSEEVVERFRQEARAVNAIRHENIVDIYDFGRDPYGRAFFVMEYLEGEPLSSRIRRGALPWAEAFPILDQTLRALKAAHDKGFVHRDLKPDNIWLQTVEGRVQVKLLDFGIAKLVGSESPQERLTQTGSVIGTPHYMSPEQINGARDIDHRTDIYAMGVITYEMFAGVTPFVGDTLQAIMTGHLFREPPRLASIPPNLGVPAPIAEIVDRMLVKDPAGRYDSVTDVLSDLYDVHRNQWPARAETLSRLRPTRPPTQAPAQVQGPGQGQGQIAVPAARPPGKGKRTGVIVGALAVAGLGIAGVAIWQQQQPEPAPVAEPAPAPTPAPGPEQPAEKPLDPEAVRKDAQAILRASLREAEPAVRVQGSDALGKLKDQPSVPALTELTEKDPDAEVRGHSGEALGAIGASDAAPLLAQLEQAAPPPLKVWYASALARLGDKGARARLLQHARARDVAVSFKAALALADTSQPGDRQAIQALAALADHNAKLNELAPYALILTRMAALRDATARKTLYALLERDHENARLAAAEGLAKLGDDAGKKILEDVLANQASPNQLAAAVALIPLGEYGGFDLITAKLGDQDPAVRRLAARALGEIGERKSLAALIALSNDKDWTLRIAAATAIVSIVGLDPQVLSQASVDWTKSALESQDWAVRSAAAGVLADLPEGEGLPLLAQAIADKDPNVRLAAATSAARMKSADAAKKVAEAAKTETDPRVKERQVRALGEIGSPAARDTLAQISEEPGRIGVLAAGSLIAVGDTSGKAKLDVAVAAPQVELRLAAVQAASAAKNPIVVPTLKTGVADRVFEVRFTAAEGLSMFGAEKQSALQVLREALGLKDAGVLGRATAAMIRFGERITAKGQTPAEMLDSADPKRRLAAVPAVRALPPSERVPLLRRLIADPDREVRRAGVDAIETLAASPDKTPAIKLYKPLVHDADAVVRSKAAGQLARLLPPPGPAPKTAGTAPAPAPAPTPAAPDTLPKVQAAADQATAASAEVKAQAEAVEVIAGDLATTLAGTTHNDVTIRNVEEFAKNLGQAAAKLEATATKVEEAARATADAAGASPSPDAAKLVDQARTLAQTARGKATEARTKATDAEKQAKDYRKKWTGDPQIYIAAADTAIATGDLADAQKNLDKAARMLRALGERNAGLDYSYAQLYDKKAARTQDRAEKRKLLQQAADAYQRFAKNGTGPRVQRARGRAAELAAELKALGPS